MTDKVRHVLGLSGGKDSAALAVYMRDRIPEMEYVFCDTQKELPETYEYLDRLQAVLGKPIARLNAERGFDHWLEVYGGYLPSSRMRWCTRMLKIRPFEAYVGDDTVVSYIGIRADEDRDGYISSKPNIKPVYPFKEDGIREADVFRILKDAGIGLPSYYEWRTRSGCYFCFFQRKAEWVGLKERHAELFEKAKAYEKVDPVTGARYTWSQSESLQELAEPERVAEIKAKHERALSKNTAAVPGQKLIQIFAAALDDDDDTEPCLICNL
jgi:3'-phosphoadenosine 5'-phosphosulfate sulfotransferase (PAPS reductase)/FAD synthetase